MEGASHFGCEVGRGIKDEDIREFQEHLASAGTIVDMIFGWISRDNRQVTLCPGYDDENGHTLVSVLLRKHGSSGEIGAVYFPIEELQAQYPGVRPVTEYAGEDDREFFSDETEKNFDERDRRLKGEYDEGLCESVYPIESVVPLMLEYALVEGGEASIEAAGDLFFEDLEMDYRERGVCSITLNYLHPETGKGFGEGAYCFLKRD